MSEKLTRVLVAGIGGASLGTEIIKSLGDAGGYAVFGCDISAYAYGHYQEGLAGTFIVEQGRYVESVRDLCEEHGIRAIIPGGEEPMALLGPATAEFKKIGVDVAANSPEVIAICSDKKLLFERLGDLGLPMPQTIAVKDVNEFGDASYPCIVKPPTGTGGSRFVFLASNRSEAVLFLSHLLGNGNSALVQEYIPLDEGEYTIGVLSLPDGRLVGSIAMRRLFHAKLSVLAKPKTGLISSGYSQGLIDEFPEVRAQAENIAMAMGSVGPMNIQGRLRNGILIPFEINPRFSASTYLRTMAGFNEVDIFLRSLLDGIDPGPVSIRPGYYLRTLSEVRVDKATVKR